MKGNIFLPIILVIFSIVISFLAGCVGQRGQLSQLSISPSLEPPELERQILENYEDQYYVNGILCTRQIWCLAWPRGYYTHEFGMLGKKNSSDVVLNMDIFKYKSPKLAEKDYLEFSRVDNLSDLDYRGINLKGKQEAMSWNSTYQCYLILSDSFIVRINGEEDIARDVLDTVIDKFG